MNKSKKKKYICKNCKNTFCDYITNNRIFCSSLCRDTFYGSNKKRTLRNGGYMAIHKWLSRHYGKANLCENPNCDGVSKIYHWALKRNKQYEHKRENFIMLCQTCHRNYDKDKNWNKNISKGKLKAKHKHTEKTKKLLSKMMVGKNIGKGCGNFKLTDEQVNNIRSRKYKYGDRKKIATEFNVSEKTITNIFKRHNRKNI